MQNKALTKADLSSLATDLFFASLKQYIDCNKPDPIARRQLECWKMNWSDGSDCQNDIDSYVSRDEKENGAEQLSWSPENYVGGMLEICGDYVAVTLEIKCIWADGDAAKDDEIVEDGKLHYTCQLKSGKLIKRKDEEEKTDRKIRKKMLSRLRQDSYITSLLGLQEDNKNHSELCLAQANIYVNAEKFELEERVDVSEVAAETLRRALWPSTTSSLDVVEVILALPSLPCRSTDGLATNTTRLANRARLRLLEDAMLSECEKEGDEQLIEDLAISKTIKSDGDQKELTHEDNTPTRQKIKKSKR